MRFLCICTKVEVRSAAEIAPTLSFRCPHDPQNKRTRHHWDQIATPCHCRLNCNMCETAVTSPSDRLCTVINLATSINIRSIRLVEELTRERIGRIHSNIVVHQCNDPLRGNAMTLQNLISVTDVCLMSIIPISF